MTLLDKITAFSFIYFVINVSLCQVCDVLLINLLCAEANHNIPTNLFSNLIKTFL